MKEGQQFIVLIGKGTGLGRGEEKKWALTWLRLKCGQSTRFMWLRVQHIDLKVVCFVRK